MTLDDYPRYTFEHVSRTLGYSLSHIRNVVYAHPTLFPRRTRRQGPHPRKYRVLTDREVEILRDLLLG